MCYGCQLQTLPPTITSAELVEKCGVRPCVRFIENLIKLDKPPAPPKHCYGSHTWKQYTGFREVYEYCIVCDTKRPTPPTKK